MRKQITWLASYPKSGNTWLRIFLANLLSNQKTPLSINALDFSSPIASARGLFDRTTGLASASLTTQQIREIQPGFYRDLAQQRGVPFYMKTHEGCYQNDRGEYLHPPEVTRRVIYLVRHPLDVLVSWANHSSSTLEQARQMLARDRWLACSKKRLTSQLPQRLGSWSAHVASWLDHAPGPLCLLRYEDMLVDPLAAFTRVVQHLELDKSSAEIAQAVQASDFSQLKAQEAAKGFVEKPLGSQAFFHRGLAGQGRALLSPEQVREVCEQHAEMLERLYPESLAV
jgi:hypothetical protein